MCATSNRVFQTHHKTQIENASIRYEQRVIDIQENKKFDDRPNPQNTAYDQLTALLKAAEAVKNKNFTRAKTELSWVLTHTKNTALKEIIRIRLARILLAEKTPELALEKIKMVDDRTFSPLIEKIKTKIVATMPAGSSH